MTKRHVAGTVVACAGAISLNAQASQLDGALDALVSGEQYLDISLVPLYQNALQAGADTGNYTLDAIGKFTLRSPGNGASLGNTDLVFWVSSDAMGQGVGLPDGRARRGSGAKEARSSW